MAYPGVHFEEESNVEVKDEIPHLDYHVSKSRIEEEIIKLMVRLKQWEPQNILLKSLSGGFLNDVISCWNKINPSEIIVIRVWFTQMSILNKKRDDEIKCVKVLSKNGCFSKLYATFQNGYCYKFYNGQCLANALEKVFEPPTIRAMARGLALVHSTPVFDVIKESWFVKETEDIKKEFTPNHWKQVLQQAPQLPSLEEYIKEIDSVIHFAKSLGNPVLLCHGDPHLANMLWNFKDEHIKFVDSDFTGYNYQAADIAYHFYSYHYDEVYGIDIYPEDDVSFRKMWLQEYLKAWFELTGRSPSDVNEDDIKKLDIQVKKFSLFTCLLFSCMCFFYSHLEYRREIDAIKFGEKMYVYYKKNKESFWNM